MHKVLLEVKDLEKIFPVKSSFFRVGSYIKAVNKISFKINEGETLGLIGETGSGKTTIGKLILRLIEPSGGSIYFKGKNILEFNNKEMKQFRKNAQMIFQDPFASLNPRQTVQTIIGLPLKIHESMTNIERKDRVLDLLEKVGVTPATRAITRYPHEFSGGQRQRIGLARALALNPKFIVADEAVASLDVSIRAQILNLMQDLKNEFKLTYLFIAHDLTVINYMSNWIMVIYLGKSVELARRESLYQNPLHPYTKALIDAMPKPDPNKKIGKLELKGEIPSPINLPSGCAFHSRCPYATTECSEKEPDFIDVGNEHYVACHRYTT